MTHIDMSQSAKSYFCARRYDPFPREGGVGHCWVAERSFGINPPPILPRWTFKSAKIIFNEGASNNAVPAWF